jgi:hypothetical protein
MAVVRELKKNARSIMKREKREKKESYKKKASKTPKRKSRDFRSDSESPPRSASKKQAPKDWQSLLSSESANSSSASYAHWSEKEVDALYERVVGYGKINNARSSAEIRRMMVLLYGVVRIEAAERRFSGGKETASTAFAINFANTIIKQLVEVDAAGTDNNTSQRLARLEGTLASVASSADAQTGERARAWLPVRGAGAATYEYGDEHLTRSEGRQQRRLHV